MSGKYEGKFERLPIWAQDLIRQLEGTSTYWEKKYREAIGEVESSIAVGSPYDPEGYIPSQSTVAFLLGGDGEYIEIRHDTHRGGVLVRGDREVVVHPEAANSLRIERAKR